MALDRRLINALKSIEQRVVDYYHEVENIFRQSMAVAGYYLHHRQWRKKGRITMPNRDQIPFHGEIQLPPLPEAIATQMRAEIAKRMFDDSQNPDALIEFYNGDPSKNYLELIMSDLSSDENQIEAFRRKARKMTEELRGRNPTPIEKLLVERIVTCDFDVACSDIEARNHCDYDDGATAAFYDRRRNRAHKRLISALKALATIRRLALPEMQSRPNADKRRKGPSTYSSN